MYRVFVLGALLAGGLWCGPGSDGWTVAAEEQFLLNARIIADAPAGHGITGSRKVTLSDGRRTHAAHAQTVNIYMPLFKGKDGSREKEFKDSWKFNVAAFRLARLLNLTDMVPVSVARPIGGKPASFDWWVDDVLMNERERVTRHIEPPDLGRWNRQMDTIRIFDQLIYNMDRSQENLLIGRNWNVWMIDHTRAFRKWTHLRDPAAITHVTPALLGALRGLKRSDVARELGEFLTTGEIDGLMARRDLIVARLAGHFGSAAGLPHFAATGSR